MYCAHFSPWPPAALPQKSIISHCAYNNENFCLIRHRASFLMLEQGGNLLNISKATCIRTFKSLWVQKGGAYSTCSPLTNKEVTVTSACYCSWFNNLSAQLVLISKKGLRDGASAPWLPLPEWTWWWRWRETYYWRHSSPLLQWYGWYSLRP